MCEFFQDSNLSEPDQKYPHMPKIIHGGFPVSSINSLHINIIYTYTYTSAHTLARSLHDVSRANNSRFAVVVCFRLAFNASGRRIFWKFSSLNFFINFVHYDDVIIR